jgi:hypothetical protein
MLVAGGPIAATATVAVMLSEQAELKAQSQPPVFAQGDVDACLAGWRAVEVEEGDDCATAPGEAATTEHMVPLFVAPAMRSADLSDAAAATISAVLAPAIVDEALRLSATAATTTREHGEASGDAASSSMIRLLLGGINSARSSLQSLLYSAEEMESPQGPWLPRGAADSRTGVTTLNAALRGVFPHASLPAEPPVLVPEPISAGDSDRPLGEAATLPALAIGSALIRALHSADSAEMGANEPAVAVHVPSHCLRLFRALHKALPGHGLLFADFHALLPQRVGPTLVDGAPGGVGAGKGMVERVLVSASSSAANAAAAAPAAYAAGDPRGGVAGSSVPPGYRRLAGGGQRDSGCLEVDPVWGTINPPVVQSKLLKGDDDAGGQSGRVAGAVSWDHPSALTPVPRGIADIFYATDFAGLAAMWLAEAPMDGQPTGSGEGRCAEVAWQPHVLDAAGVTDAGRTRSGFNPMLHDYANTSFLIAWPRPTTRAAVTARVVE